VFEVPPEAKVWFRLVGGSDKPRNYSFTIHGLSWLTTHISEAGRRVGSVSGVTSGWVETFSLTAPTLTQDLETGEVPEQIDLAYRTGVLKWSLPQGLWGILRVRGNTSSSSTIAAGGEIETPTKRGSITAQRDVGRDDTAVEPSGEGRRQRSGHSKTQKQSTQSRNGRERRKAKDPGGRKT
jgi:hypothetical protein